MKPHIVTRRALILPSLVAMVLLIGPLAQTQGQTISWNNPGTGSFTDGANWQGAQVPQGFNSIVIGNGGTAQASGSIDVEDVTLGTGDSGTLEIFPGITSSFTPDTVYVGYSAPGTLSVGSQALVATEGDFFVGYSSNTTGVVSLDGATLSPFTVYFGNEGNATVSFENGSLLQSTTGYVGYAAGSQGVVTLSSSTWKAENEGLPVDITVGVSGIGEVQATNSTLSSQNLVLGNATSSTGVVAFGGGTMTIANNLQVGNAGTGNLSLTNSASVSAYSATVAVLADSTGSLSMTNSSLTSTRDATIGLGGNGTLTTNGATFHAPNLFLGDEAGATGSATVSGGTMTLSEELHVGAHGTGTFTLNGGGHLETVRGNMAFASGAVGTTNILDGTWTNTQAIFVGVSGNGTLNVGADGVVQSESGYIAQEAAGVGTVSVTGGSWTMSNTLAVGTRGTGELSVADGGHVSSQWSQVGLNSGAFGVVNVGNATWTTNQTLTIGSSGNGGQVYVTAGGNLTAGAIELAASAGVTGSLSVVNSTVTTENIIEGGGTDGSVYFSDAQLKLLGGSSVIDTLLINGFAPGAVVVGSGGLTVDTQGGNAQITTVLSGNGSLTKVGTGRLRLTEANIYAGGTQIQGGVLEVANDAALADGDVTLGSAELRASTTTTLSGNLSSGIQLISVSGNQTGTFSATTGQSLTLAPLDFLLVAGSTMRVGSAGNNGTVIFAPTGAVALPADVEIVVDNGTLQAGSSDLLFMAGIAESVTVAAGATLDFNDQVSGGAIGTLLGSGTVQIGSSPASVLAVDAGNFAGSILGAGSLTKQGPGALVLSGNNTLAGGATVSGGTLQVNGFLGNGPVEIGAGGTLGGTGTVAEIVLNGGTLAPGASAGTLTTGDLYWESGTLVFELGPSSDHLVADGLDGTVGPYFFTFENLGWSAGATYDLIGYSNSLIDVNDFAYTNGGGFSGTFAYADNVLTFTITAVPEPSTWLLIGVATAGAGLLRRQRA